MNKENEELFATLIMGLAESESRLAKATLPPDIKEGLTGLFSLIRFLKTELEKRNKELAWLKASRPPLSSWRYKCGHIVAQKEQDDCPICKEPEELKKKYKELDIKLSATEYSESLFEQECKTLEAKVKRLTAAAEGVVWRERAEGLKFGDDVVIDSLESVLKAQSEGSDK